MNFSFLLRLIIVAVVAWLGYYFLYPYIPDKLKYHNYLYILIFFVITTYLFHLGLVRSAVSGVKSFIRFYMGATGAKLFIYIGIIMVYAVINKPGVKAFAFCFLLYYCLFTVFEVFTAYKQFGNLRSNTATDNKVE